MIEKKIASQNLDALIPHEIAVFEMALSRPFFICSSNKFPIKSDPKIVRAE